MSRPIREIIRFQTDRELDKKDFNVLNEQANIIEEVFEMDSYDIPKEQRKSLSDRFELFTHQLIEDGILVKRELTEEEKEHEEVDALNDIIVFAIGGIMKKGYYPAMTMMEASKEINSREGIMINGKFEKYVDDDSKAKWYKADYTICKTN